MTRVLFLCTGNAARSQMAEGLYRYFSPGDEVVSAGSRPLGRVLPEAIEVMREIEIDISHHTSKSVQPLLNEPFDLVVTVCDSAAQACPSFPGARRVLHWSVPDPANAAGSIPVFRSLRGDLIRRIKLLLMEHALTAKGRCCNCDEDRDLWLMKNFRTGRLFIRCDVCGIHWLHPDDISKEYDPEVDSTASAAAGEIEDSIPARRVDVEQAGWSDFIA